METGIGKLQHHPCSKLSNNCNGCEHSLNLENINSLTEGDYTTQSFLSISAPDSFESVEDSNNLESSTEELIISSKFTKTPPYPVLKDKKDNLVPPLRKSNKINFQMNIPLPTSPPISPFCLKQKENLNPSEVQNIKSPLQKIKFDSDEVTY